MNDNVPFVIPLYLALQRLQQEMFGLFLLTIENNTVSIFTDCYGLLKIFDSHARDSFGMPHPHGTCVLLEVDSITNLVVYFKELYRAGAIFEVKGVKINEIMQNVGRNDLTPYDSSDSSTINEYCNYNNAQSNYVFLYAICFSTIKACNNWNDQTEIAIAEHTIELLDKFSFINPFLSDYQLICPKV